MASSAAIVHTRIAALHSPKQLPAERTPEKSLLERLQEAEERDEAALRSALAAVSLNGARSSSPPAVRRRLTTLSPSSLNAPVAAVTAAVADAVAAGESGGHQRPTLRGVRPTLAVECGEAPSFPVRPMVQRRPQQDAGSSRVARALHKMSKRKPNRPLHARTLWNAI